MIFRLSSMKITRESPSRIAGTSEVYIHVRNFISRPSSAPPQITLSAEAIETHTRDLQRLAERTQEVGASISDLERAIGHTAMRRINPTIINAEVVKIVERLRKCRLFGAFDTIGETRSLVADLEHGDLASASDAEKATALAWCARFPFPPRP